MEKDAQTILAAKRLAKAARRQKQREANVPRAQKMHLARLEGEALGKPGPQAPQAGSFIHIGCSGWFYWGWKGRFYPEGLPTSRWFGHYAEHFQTVELNAPFYSWPTVNNVKSWIRQAEGKPFVYTVKACELITHVRQFKRVRELVKDFGLIADLLGERMGCFLFQFPPSFHYTPARLKAIVTQLDPDRRNVVEFRHKSWWNETVYRNFRKHGVIFCSCSGPKLPDELIETAHDIYIRFHGIERWYRHDYSDQELAQWADKIKACGAKRIWIYFNNDFDGYAIKNAKSLLTLLEHS